MNARYLEVLAASQGCDSLHWIKLLEGLAMGIQCFAGEAPFLFLSGKTDIVLLSPHRMQI